MSSLFDSSLSDFMLYFVGMVVSSTLEGSVIEGLPFFTYED